MVRKHRAASRGSALVVALCLASVLAIALASYLTLSTRTLQMSSRNLNSGRSLDLAESGLEDALWALNKSTWTGWTISGTTATKTVTGFTYESGATGKFATTVTNYNVVGATRLLTSTGTTTMGDGATSNRTLSASAMSTAALFVNALAATGSTVTFTSGGTADSYDSSLGDYTAPTAGYSAIIASTAAAPSSATIGLVNAQIKGYAASFYSGGPSYGTTARLMGPSTPGTTKIDTARISNSPYQPVFDIKTPSGTGITLANPTTNSTTTIGFSTDLSPRLYYSGGFDLTGTTKIIVDGPVQLVMTGGGAFYIGLHGGTPSFQINTTGSLEVFTTGDIAIYGGGISNATKNPRNLAIYGTNALTVPDMSTTTPFYGVLYTPNGNFTVAGNAAIYGALVAKKISFTGSTPAIHYDLNLRQGVFAGIDTPFFLANISEVANP